MTEFCVFNLFIELFSSSWTRVTEDQSVANCKFSIVVKIVQSSFCSNNKKSVVVLHVAYTLSFSDLLDHIGYIVVNNIKQSKGSSESSSLLGLFTG